MVIVGTATTRSAASRFSRSFVFPLAVSQADSPAVVMDLMATWSGLLSDAAERSNVAASKFHHFGNIVQGKRKDPMQLAHLVSMIAQRSLPTL